MPVLTRNSLVLLACGGGVTDSTCVISINDKRRIVSLISSALMNEEECVACVFGSTLRPRRALLLPMLSTIVGEVLEPSEPSLWQFRLSIRPPEPRTSYLAGWSYTQRDRTITCKEIGKRHRLNRERWAIHKLGKWCRLDVSRCSIAIIYREDKKFWSIQVKLGYICEIHHVTGCYSRNLVCMQQQDKHRDYMLRKGC